MAKKQFRATINQSGVRAGDVVDLDDADPAIQAKVAGGFLIPVDAKGNAKPAPAPAPAPKDDASKADASKSDAPKSDSGK